MTVFYDGSQALVTDRVLVVRGFPPRDLWIDQVEKPRVVALPAGLGQRVIYLALLGAVLVMVAWPSARQPGGFAVGAAVMLLALLGQLLLRWRRPRLYELRADHDGVETVLLTSTDRRELVRIARAVEVARTSRRRSRLIADTTDSGDPST